MAVARALDAYRRRFESTPETLTNAILLGSLLVPLGISLHRRGRTVPQAETARRRRNGRRARELGELPLARRDVERLRQILGLQRRLRDVAREPARASAR